MPLSAGDKLGPYEIVTSIGAGGMGAVYRARDPRMGREVAIKVSSERFSDRFSREVHAIASLNHPNICHLYDVGPDYLVMELVDGPTLEQRIKLGAVPLEDALKIARQIADALEAAHNKGIVHRDLKPANIILKPDGSVKVLDFGLAQVGSNAAGSEQDVERSPTMSMAATRAGVILGTAAYMAPEQARGELVDKRADIWAFGVVLYEMLAGQRIYEGKTVSDVLAAVLIKEPDMSKVPPEVRSLLRHCLEKDPKERLRDVGDFKLLLTGPEAAASRALGGRRFSLIGWSAAAVLLLAAAIGWLRTNSPATETPGLALTIVPPPGLQLAPVGGQAAMPQISPDGSAVLFAANGGLYVRRLDSFHATLVPGSEMSGGEPFWSADSGSVFYPSYALGGLMKVRVPDGAPEVVMQLLEAPRGGSSNGNGTILVTGGPGNGLYSLAAPGSKAEHLDVPGLTKGAILYPEFLPAGDAVLFLWRPADGTGNEIYLASFQGGKVVDPVSVLQNDTAARYCPAGGGRILFVRNDNLYSQKLDLRQRKLVGDSQLIAEHVASGPGMFVDRADFSVSRSGVLAWRPGTAALSQVTAFDRKGTAIGTSGPPSPISSLRLSPDETRLLARGERSWLLDVGQPSQLDLGASPRWTLWSTDGSTFIGWDEGKIVERSVNRSGEVRELGDGQRYQQDLAPDGSKLLSISPSGREIDYQDLDGDAEKRRAKVVVGVNSAEIVSSPAISPDGHWIVYDVISGDRQNGGIFVQPFPGPGLRRQVVATSGVVQWSGSGKEILYESRGGIYSVGVDTVGGELRFGTTVLLFSGVRVPAGLTNVNRPLAVSRDGQRIFWPQATEQPGSDVIQIRTRGVN